MFKNKILVKASLSPASSFFLIPLSLPSPSSPTDPPLSVELEVLSWKLSRKWRLACLARLSEILVVYQKSQSDLVDHVVSEFVKLNSSIRIGVEEEVKSGPLIAKAIEIGLRCLMLDHKWICIGDNTFVKSTFSTCEERANVHAVNVRVQSAASEEVILLVSPETVRFSRHQISDLISLKNVDKFENKKEVILESWNFSTACTTLPSLFEGYVIGISKILPEGVSVNYLQDLWSVKHGLTLKSNHYVRVQSSYGSFENTTWFPSSFVLQSSGLTPAPKTIRVSQAILAFQSFIGLLKAWDFFGGALLVSKEQSLIDSSTRTFSWEKVTHNLPCCFMNTDFISKDPLSALDFRTLKPDRGCFTEKNMDRNKNNSVLLTDGDSKDAPNKGQTPLLVPAFTKIRRKATTNSSASIILKGGSAHLRTIQDNYQGTAKSQKNETVLVSSPSDSPLNTQTSAGSARAEKHSISVKHNTSSTSVGSVEPTKKNDVNTDNKFTADGQLVSTEHHISKAKTKAKPKQTLDKDEVTTKVLNCHKRGQLQSLTVADLKCFLACKKAKVGGTKEELIRRAIVFLG